MIPAAQPETGKRTGKRGSLDLIDFSPGTWLLQGGTDGEERKMDPGSKSAGGE